MKALESKLAEAFIKEIEILIITKLINILRGVESAENDDNLKL